MKVNVRCVTAIIVSLCITGNWAGAQLTDTIREIPKKGASSGSKPTVTYHPEYKKLVDELRRLQEQLKSGDDNSVAQGRRRVDAAAARLNAYINSGKPTVLSGPPQQTSGGGNTGNTTAAAGTKVTPSKEGTGGPRRLNVSECAVSFGFYEKLQSEDWTPTACRTLIVDSIEYALSWKGQSFSVEHKRKLPREDDGKAGWHGERVMIKGRISENGDVLETITFENQQNGKTGLGEDYSTSESVTLINVPLHSMEDKDDFTLYIFQVDGANKVKQHVQQYSKMTDGKADRVNMRWDVTDSERVLGRREEPRIKIWIHKPTDP